MTKSAMIDVKEGKVRLAINGFLKDLFAKKVVEAMLVPLAHPAGTNVVQALISDAAKVDAADVFAPVMPVNSAKILQAMTRLTPSDRKTAVVIRPCEMRAVVELIKLKQIQPANLLFIGIDCPGAYSVKNYPKLAAERRPRMISSRPVSNGRKMPCSEPAARYANTPIRSRPILPSA